MRLVKENKAVLFLGGFLLGFLLMNMGKNLLISPNCLEPMELQLYLGYFVSHEVHGCGQRCSFLLCPEKALFENVRTYFAADNLSGGAYLRCYDCMVRIISGRFFVYPVTAVWNQRIFDCPGGHISPIYFLCASDIAVIAVGGQGSCRNPGGVEKKVSAFTDTGAASAGMFIGRICKSGNIA